MPWKGGPTINDPDIHVDVAGVSAGATVSGFGPDINGPGQIEIVLPPENQGDDDTNVIRVNPNSPALPGGAHDHRYDDTFNREERRQIRYPCSVAMYADEFTEERLPEVLNRLNLNWNGDLYWHGGKLYGVAGYARTPLGTVVDGVDVTVTDFSASDAEREQWNAFSATIEAGDLGGETTILEVVDDDRVMRSGGH